MSMHLVGPYLTTTSYKKRKDKVTKAQQEELERGWRERNVRLREMGLPKETFEQYQEWVYGKGKKAKKEVIHKAISKTATTAAPVRVDQAQILGKETDSCKNNEKEQTHGKLWTTGAVTTKQAPAYTGSKIIGIGIMHKSNLVPIFSSDEAQDIAKMRR